MRPEAIGSCGALTAALVLAAAQSAIAQQLPSDPPNTVAETERMQSHSAWHLSRSVSGHVGRLLAGTGTGGGGAQGTAPAATMREAPEDRGPVASATAGAPFWSVWVGPNVSWSDQNGSVAGNEGHTLTTYLGLDRRIGGRGVVGLLAGHESSDFDTVAFRGRLEVEGLGVGVYGGYALTDVVVVDALALYSWLDNDYSDRFRSASYDSGRLQLSANVTGYLREGRVRIRPKLGLAWSSDEQEAYRDTLGLRSPETEVETLSGTAGVQVGYSLPLDSGRSLEPWLGATAVLEDSSSHPDAAAGSDELGTFDLRLAAGLNAQLAERLSLSLNADVSGLARTDYEAVTLGAQLSLQF